MTKIQWTEKTWNPVTGCTKISPGCKNCYAEPMSKRLAGRFGYLEAPDNFNLTIHIDRMFTPHGWKKPKMIFVCSMGDLFHEDVPDDYIEEIFGTMIACRRHTFQILTKRPERAAEFMVAAVRHWDDPLKHLWFGVSAENQEQADKRIPVLLQIPAAVRFVSVEPMLERVDIPEYQFTKNNPGGTQPGGSYIIPSKREGIDWVICGAESGPGARPMELAWVRGLAIQCIDAKVPFFMKQISNKAPIPEDLMIREYPDVK